VAGSVNKVILIGNVGQDPEVRHLENGGVVAHFSIATTETYTDKTSGERKKTTDWHNIVAWGELAKIIERYITKGMKIYIEGRMRTRSWTDKDGNTRYVTEVLANNITMLSNSNNQSSEQNKPNPYPADGTPAPFTPMSIISEEEFPSTSDDLPF